MLGSCSSYCDSNGCWGPGDDQCIQCVGYLLNGHCVDFCDLANGFYVNATARECFPCHNECVNSCTGPVSFTLMLSSLYFIFYLCLQTNEQCYHLLRLTNHSSAFQPVSGTKLNVLYPAPVSGTRKIWYQKSMTDWPVLVPVDWYQKPAPETGQCVITISYFYASAAVGQFRRHFVCSSLYISNSLWYFAMIFMVCAVMDSL